MLLRSIATRLRESLLNKWRVPPPSLGFEYAGFGQGIERAEDHELDCAEDDDVTREDQGILFMAVPKRRVTRRRKRIKFFQKHLEPLEGFVTCPECQKQHPHHYQLCPFCKPFNNYIKTKDVPTQAIQRIKRRIENSILDNMWKEREQQVLQAREQRKQQQAQAAANKHQEADKSAASTSGKGDEKR